LSIKRLAKESLVYGLSGYISKSISLFLLPLYTAVLTPEDYGILDLLGTIVIISTFLIVSGTDTSVGYFYFRREHINERNLIICSSMYVRLLFSLAALVVIILISGYLSKLLFGKELSIFIIVTGISIVFQSFHSFLFNLLRLEFRIWLYTILSTLNVLSSILLTIYFVLILKQGVWGAIIAQTISYGLIFIWTLFYVIKRYGYNYSWQWMKDILSYGFPLIGTGVAYWVLNSTDRYFLAHYADLSSVGIYAVGSKLASIVGIIGGALQISWGPYAMDIQYEKNAKEIYAKVFQIYFIFNIFLILGISMFAADILKVFTQPDYYSARSVVPFLCTSVFLVSGYFIVSIGINLTKKVQHTIWITIIAALLNILMNYLLTPRFGAIGAAFCIMISNLLIFLLTYAVSQRYYPIQYKISFVIILAVPAIIMIVVSYSYDLSLILKILLTFLYTALALILTYRKYKDSDELKKIVSLVGFTKSSEP
jgi:O-antigen/teichoic acid export membrane protein